MIKTMYVQTDKNNVVRDILEYQYSDYEPIELELPLPLGIMNGSFKLENGELVEYPELRPPVVTTEEVEQRLVEAEEENKTLKTTLTGLEETVGTLMLEVAALKGGNA